MKYCIRATFLALMVVFSFTTTALAALKTFTIAPFTVNGPSTAAHLEQSIPHMLASRLFWQGNFQQSTTPGTTKKLSPADTAAADKALATANADYVIWGSVTAVGNNFSVDVRVRDKTGKEWPLSRESNIDRLIPDVRQIADSISAQVFQRPQAAAARNTSQLAPVNQMNPSLVRNETTGAQTYINPQFRYAGKNDDESRLRSQQLPYASVGMEVCDTTGDGQQLVFILSDRKLEAYRFESDSRLTLLGKVDLPATQQTLSIRSIDLDHTGRAKLVINSKDSSEELIARIFSFDGKNFKEEYKIMNVYLSVVKMPPMYRDQLIGQRTNPPHLFLPGISEASVRGKKIILGSKINLPKDFNVFNFAYIPAGVDRNDSVKMIMLDSEERLRLYSEKGTRMSSTEESYSGAVQGIYVDTSMPGLGKDREGLGQTYFIPMRILAVDLDQDGNHEIIVNKPISTAGLIFSNYRSFPQSEIHSLQWDGLGLSLVWKTRPIKGSVVDYTITDVNNDGVLDLVACVNTHPGALGAAARKTVVIAYPLDLSQADPRIKPNASE